MYPGSVGQAEKLTRARQNLKLVKETRTMYEGESSENRKNFFKFNLLNESGTQLYHFST
jgi:hypothetical protein